MSTEVEDVPQVASDGEAGTGTSLIAVAAFSCLVVALQQTIVVPATPRFPEILGHSPDAVSWLVTATLLTGAVATPIISRLSDLLGRRRMLVVAMVFVLVGSVLAPLGGLGTIVTGRAFQGLGTALVPVAMAQMRDSLPARRVGPSLAILSATLGVGGGIGIPLGGVILSGLGWRWLFWVSALLAVVSVVLLARVMPRQRSVHSGGFDLTGAVLLSLALLALLLGVSQGNAWGWTSAVTLLAFAVGVVVLVAWAAVELRVRSPLVDLRATVARPLLCTNLASLLLGVLMFANLLLTTQQLQAPDTAGGFGWSAQQAGLAMLPNAAAMFVVAPLTATFARWWGPRWVLGLGGAVTALGYVLRLFVSSSAPFVIGWATVIGIGVGIGYAALPMLIVRHAPGREIGAANGVNALLRAIGTAVASAGVAAVGALWATTVEGEQVAGSAAFRVIALIAGALALVTVGFAVLARDGRARRDPEERP